MYLLRWGTICFFFAFRYLVERRTPSKPNTFLVYGAVRHDDSEQSPFFCCRCHLIQGIRTSWEFDKFLHLTRHGSSVRLIIGPPVAECPSFTDERGLSLFKHFPIQRAFKVGIGPAVQSLGDLLDFQFEALKLLFPARYP